MILCTEIKQKQPQDRETDFETLSLPVAKILSPVARQAPTKTTTARDVTGCGFFAYSWKFPAYSGVFLFFFQLTSFAFFTYNWSFFVYSFSFLAYSWSFFAYSGKVHLIGALSDCKQKTVSNKTPTVSKKTST